MAADRCPTPDELSRYLNRSATAAAAHTVAAHLGTCAACQKALVKLESQPPNLAETELRPQPASAAADDDNAPHAAAEPAGRPALAATASFEQPGAERSDLAVLGRLGEYELLAKLGQGGMGAVYKARHVKLKRVVALKTLPHKTAKDPHAIARFEREMEAVGRVDHPNIVRAHDAREINGRLFLVMEYVGGLDLAQFVERHGPLPVADACELVRQAALGLQYAHEHGLESRQPAYRRVVVAQWN